MVTKSPVRLGLTGGIGSGKSTVAAMFTARGAGVIDADAISRAVTAPGGAAIGPIQAAFGERLIDDTGAMDRAAMRALVLSNVQAKRRLEGIIHPLVGAATLAAAAALQSRLVVYDIPLLVEGGMWSARLDYVLVIDCKPSTQVQRVLGRAQSANWTGEQVLQAIAAQASRQQRLAAADIVIANEALTLSQLEACVWEIADHFGL
jgi:dephospho-CoA kinase